MTYSLASSGLVKGQCNDCSNVTFVKSIITLAIIFSIIRQRNQCVDIFKEHTGARTQRSHCALYIVPI